MSGPNDALVQLFTRRTGSYDRLIRGMLYPQGFRAFPRRSSLLRGDSVNTEEMLR
jgi:hypothetical protein